MNYLFDVAPKRRRKKPLDGEWASRALNGQADVVMSVISGSGLKRFFAEDVLKEVNKSGHDFELRHVKASMKILRDQERIKFIPKSKEYPGHYVVASKD